MNGVEGVTMIGVSSVSGILFGNDDLGSKRCDESLDGSRPVLIVPE